MGNGNNFSNRIMTCFFNSLVYALIIDKNYLKIIIGLTKNCTKTR